MLLPQSQLTIAPPYAKLSGVFNMSVFSIILPNIEVREIVIIE